MYLVFIGSDHTTYMKLFAVFYSFDNALDKVVELLKKFGGEYEDEYVKTKMRQSYEDSFSGHTPNTGIFYFRKHSDLFNEPFVGIKQIDVGDCDIVATFTEKSGVKSEEVYSLR